MIRDQYKGAQEGEITITFYLLLGSPHLPFGQSTIIETHPKLS